MRPLAAGVGGGDQEEPADGDQAEGDGDAAERDRDAIEQPETGVREAAGRASHQEHNQRIGTEQIVVKCFEKFARST